MNAVVRLEPPITPRPDQLDALDAILDALARAVRRPLIEAPCAWGKSVLIGMVALTLVRTGRRVLILAHRHELLEQNTGALLRLDPAADVGICSASLRSDRLDAAIVVGGTATIFRRLQRLGHVDAVLLDEAHLLGPGSTSMLGTILKSLSDPPLIGFTAISEVLREQGVRHAVITGETPTEVRADAIARFRAGELTALVNCNVLSVGFDARNIDLIAFMRPTVSPVLWTQAAGRGMRTWPGKADCRLLDFGGNIHRHGPINAIKLRPQGARHDAQAAADRVRICPRCDEINEITTAVCTSCGMVLIKPRISVIEAIESTAPAIDAQADRPRWVRVHTMRGGIHEKPGRPPSFRLRYSTEEGWVSEFLSLEHEKPGARWYAGKAWTRLSRTPGAAPPVSVRDAYQRFISGELREPQRLRIERDGQWWRVVDVERAAS